jgi:pimeloyl-ACP methyl ester carboxylesterase
VTPVMPRLTVNRAELHYEIRGAGPPVLPIMGTSGDTGHFQTLAELLADGGTVASYDRRGTRRSPRPPRWMTTSPQEQADDAAALRPPAETGVTPSVSMAMSGRQQA